MISIFFGFGVSNIFNFSLLDPTGNALNINTQYFNFSKYPSSIFNYPCPSPYSCTPYTGVLQPGLYLIECWGAAGGSQSMSGSLKVGGYGGYTFGYLSLSDSSRVFLHIGGKGRDGGILSSDSEGGYNGGGSGGYGSSYHYGGGGGGGSTDVRIGFNAIGSRYLVAGGGGGASYNSIGGNAGGEIGEKGEFINFYSDGGEGGSQTVGGSSNCLYAARPGSILFGGRGAYRYSNFGSGGGGGGYFGGGGGSPTSVNYDSSSGGGGGSGYYRLQHEFLYRGYIPGTSNGGSSFPAPNGGYEIGHSTNGAIRLTLFEDTKSQYANIPTSLNHAPVLSLSYMILHFSLICSILYLL